MTWYPQHPGGIMTCDAPGCTRERRNYCPPAEREQWVAFMDDGFVRDLCPEHRDDRASVPKWLTWSHP